MIAYKTQGFVALHILMLILSLLYLCAVSVFAVQNEADLQSAYTSAITAAEETPMIESSGSPIDYEFAIGRATNYAYNQDGACGFGDINADESLGNPLYIAAIPDCAPIFPGSCGICYEIQCRNAIIEDDLGAELDRTSACYDETASVVLRVVDSCPSYYPANQASNSRWCSCANLAHFDISTEAFVQLADMSYGVIGTSWRRVTCDYTPENPAPVRDTQTFASPPPDPSKDQHRTFPDWTQLKGSWVVVQDYQALNPSQVNTPNIYSSIAGDLLPGWRLYLQMTGNADNASTPEPASPVTTGRGGQGSPLCRWAGKDQGIALSSTQNATGVNTTQIAFWIYAGNFTSADLLVNIGSQTNTSILCNYANTETFSAAAENDGWLSYTVFVPSLQQQTCNDPVRVFDGCGGNDPSEFDSVYFLNPLPNSQWICLDDILWR